jgi:hypothetical protein
MALLSIHFDLTPSSGWNSEWLAGIVDRASERIKTKASGHVDGTNSLVFLGESVRGFAATL